MKSLCFSSDSGKLNLIHDDKSQVSVFEKKIGIDRNYRISCNVIRDVVIVNSNEE